MKDPPDLAILREFAKKLGHNVAGLLERPFVHYVATNLPEKARDHFFGLQEAKRDLVGIAIFDNLDKNLQEGTALTEMMWLKKEIENYLCVEDVLLAYARHDQPDDLFGQAESARREQTMRDVIGEISAALKALKKPDPWSSEIKVTDEFLDPVFEKYFEKLGLPNLLRKTDYHLLANFVSKEKIDHEVIEKLDAIVKTASKAKPLN